MSKTPPKVMELLTSALATGISKRALCREIGINSNALDLYLEGAIEPRKPTLEKMAKYFKTSVTKLLAPTGGKDRVMDTSNPDMARALEILDSLSPRTLKKVVDMLELLQDKRG